MAVYIRFERGRDGVIGPTYGPYPFVQITYDLIRVGPDGDELAQYCGSGDWQLVDKEYDDTTFSDAIVYTS